MQIYFRIARNYYFLIFFVGINVIASYSNAADLTETFESSSLTTNFNEAANSITINSDTNYTHSGTYSAKITYANNESSGLLQKYYLNASHVYASWYEYFQTGFDFPLFLKMTEWIAIDNVKPILSMVGAELGNGDFGDHAVGFIFGSNGNIGDPLFGGSYVTYTLVTGQWYHFEMELKLNTPGVNDGIARLWINRVLIRNVTNANIRGGTTENFNRMWIGGNYSNSNAGSNPTPNPNPVSYRYIDDITLSLSGAPKIPSPPVIRRIE